MRARRADENNTETRRRDESRRGTKEEQKKGVQSRGEECM